MVSDNLNVKQATALYLVFLCSNLLVTYGNLKSGSFALIALIVGAIGFLLPAILYVYILKFRQTVNIYDTVKILFPRTIYIAFSVLLVAVAFIYGCMSLKIFTQMISATALPDTPPILMAVCVCILSAVMIKSGLSVVGKSAFVFFLIIFLSVLSTLLFSLIDCDFENIVGDFEFASIAHDTLYFFCTSFCKTVIFLGAISHISGTNHSKKVIFGGIVIATIIIGLSLLRDLLILGENTIEVLQFPSVIALSTISLYDFLQRIEVISTINMLFCSIIETSVCVYCVCIGISRLCSLSIAKNIAIPIGVVFATASQLFISDNAISVFYYFCIALSVFAIISSVVISIKIKNRDKKKKSFR